MREKVVDAISEGVRNKNGFVIGILPEQDYRSGNKFLSIPVAIGIGAVGNALLTYNGDAGIAIAGDHEALMKLHSKSN